MFKICLSSYDPQPGSEISASGLKPRQGNAEPAELARPYGESYACRKPDRLNEGSSAEAAPR